MSVVSKVLEKCIFSVKCFPFFQPKLYHPQDGFVSGRSYVTNLLRSTLDFAKALDEKNQIDAVVLDYSKAFDNASF